MYSFLYLLHTNGTYWAAGRLLEQVKYEKEQAKKLATKAGGKRKSDSSDNESCKKAKTNDAKPATLAESKVQRDLEAQQLIKRILAVEGVSSNSPVYDSCPQLVKKIKDFVERPGITKAAFCSALDNLNNNLLGRFLGGKGQDQCGNITYARAYVFFEKLRILEGKPKSASRKKNEAEKPQGFSLVKARANQWFLMAR